MEITKNILFESVPNSWSDLDFSDYIYLVDIKNKYLNEELNSTEYLFETLELLTGIDINNKVYYTLTNNETRNLSRTISFLKNLPTHFEQKIEIDGEIYELMDLDSMKVNEYTALDYYLTTDIVNNLHRIAAILYRKHKLNEFGNKIREPFNYNYEERAELFFNTPMNVGYCVEYFKEFRLKIQDMFPYVFVKPENNDELTEDELKELEEQKQAELKAYNEMSFREKAAYKENKRKELLQQQFAWEYLLLDLSKGDIVAAHKMYEFEILYVFNMLNVIKAS
jgi:hypothetical protein